MPDTGSGYSGKHSGEAAIEAVNTKYNISNLQIAYHPADTPLKQGSYRGLASTATYMARLLNMDQLEFRLTNTDDLRMKAVMESATKAFG